MNVTISICDERDWKSYTRTASMPSCWEVWIFILSSENKEVTECRHFTCFFIFFNMKTYENIGINQYDLLLFTFPPNF